MYGDVPYVGSGGDGSTSISVLLFLLGLLYRHVLPIASIIKSVSDCAKLIQKAKEMIAWIEKQL